MRRRHFAAFAPHCPVCATGGRGCHPLGLATVLAEDGDDVEAGILHCGNAACRHEYPIIAGLPLLTPRLRPLLAERGIELLLRDDLDPALESLLGDALGPDTWFDAQRQALSTYGWDGWADLDPEEPAAAELQDGPGGARRCLRRLLDLAGASVGGDQILDLGCGAGRTAYELAASADGALVLGLDLGLGLLRLARAAGRGRVSYPRRRVGLVYDRRDFDVPRDTLADQVDFWACDVLALPFAPATIGCAVALQLLDSVADPARLLREVATVLRPGGRLLLATPWDWSARATPPEAWLGGHSQRGATAGAPEPAFARLAATERLRIVGEDPHWPWRTRLHDRASVSYDAHLAVLERSDGSVR